MENLHWKRNGQIIEISSLQELYKTLMEIPIEQVDNEVQQNKTQLKSWIEGAGNLQLEAHMKEEFTPQQLHERLIRDLRQIV